MELNMTKYHHCLGCLCHDTERDLEYYTFQNATFKAMFQDNMFLCYVCTKLAQNVEQFVGNVQNNQLLLESTETISDATIAAARNQLDPLVNLSKETLCSIDSSDSKNVDEPISVIYGSKGIEVKLELKKEASLDYFGEEFVDSCEFQNPTVKDEDVDLQNDMKEESDLLEDINLKLLSKKLKKNKLIGNGKTNVYKENKKRKNKDCFVTVIHITKEQCEQEREDMMKDPKYTNSVYRCEDCIKGFIFKESYEKHMQKHCKTMGEFECDVCKQRMSTMDKLLSHQKYHKMYKCPECGLVRISRLTITDHFTATHATDGFLYTCAHCDKTFRRQVSLKKHVANSHRARARPACPYCHKTYANKEVLKGHLIRAHPSEVSSPAQARHVCGDCGRGFRAPSQLRNHMVKHSGERNYYCVECDRSFKSDAALKQHLKIALPHVNYMELPLPCTHCDKRFSVRRDLDRHVNRVHLNIKPHQCDKCDKAYINGWSLREHKSYAHDGRKRPLNFPCPYCDKVFDRNATRKAHVRTHTGERPYACSACPARFAQASVRATHHRLVHLRLARDGRPKPPARPKPHNTL